MSSPIKTADVGIIGGGPAGISAALWCDELGLESILIEQETGLGGQLRQIYNPIENYLGLSAPNGDELLSRFEKSIASRNFVRSTGIKATSIDITSMQIHLSDGDSRETTVRCIAVIVATGVSRRQLDVPGEDDFRGKGILESGARDKHGVSGQKILIVGGGDAAFENALILSEFAASVSVAYRKPEPTARREFFDAARARSNVHLLPSTVVTRIDGDTSVRSVELAGPTGAPRKEQLDGVLIRIGVKPNSEAFRGALDLDESGYINVDHAGRTNVSNIYAVGDVANKFSPTLSTAVGTAATAVKAILHALRNSDGL